MRIIPFLVFAIISTSLVILFDSKLLLPAPLGKLLAPQQGLWQNAEPYNANFSEELKSPNLKGKVDVYLDERLVPHIFAEKENDVYFVQGYLHAKFRLWQMELQTMAAAGRASEIVGDVALNHDREFRRLGMVYAAENSLKEMEANYTTKAECDAYTSGVNAYIESLTESSLPVEYKLLGYHPEKWSNFKTALFLKYMSYELAAKENDFEMTNAKGFFSPEDFEKLFPQKSDSLDPIIPKGTKYTAPLIKLKPPADVDSNYLNSKETAIEYFNKPDAGNGSNNWAVNGSKTISGYPILCNDPHLGLNLPSLWYEMQLSTPTYNAYGVSFPGAPGIIIGFNDNCAFGFTNAGRDVRDYYEIKFKDDSRKEYWFDSAWKKAEIRIENIKIAGKPDIFDTVAYTVFGPVMYDKSFSGKRTGGIKSYAVRWKAHDNSNELLMFNLLNHAANYADFSNAVSYLHTPGQNAVFASKNGEIALRTQGEFPAKWKNQGDFIMPGTDSSYMWQSMIPQDETPLQYNPARGFVSSANQRPVDSTYPYYLGNDYGVARGITINKKLAGMGNITPKDMMQMQTNNYNVFGEMAMPVLLNNIKMESLNNSEKKYVEVLKKWNFHNDASSTGATAFVILWDNFADTVFADEYAKAPKPIMFPSQMSLLENLLKDPDNYKFLDNIETLETESLQDVVTQAFKKTAKELKTLEENNKLEWAKYKDTHVDHLLKLPAFSRQHLPIGGGLNVINATKENHGPSWRMVVSLTPETEAYGAYPGGQSGNPGSRFYDNFINYWAAGKYYRLWMMKATQQNDERIKWRMSFGKL